jgi:serine protease Do
MFFITIINDTSSSRNLHVKFSKTTDWIYIIFPSTKHAPGNGMEGAQQMNELMIIPTSKKRRRPIFKTAILVLCVISLMLGSGYAGARIAQGNQYELLNGIALMQAHNPHETNAVSNIELLNNVTQNNNSLTLPELFAGANPAVVAISTEVTGRNAFGRMVTRPATGSGFFVSSNGYIVTNDHVIENANSIMVLLYDGNEYPAALIGRDPESDIAVIKIEGTDWPFLSFGNSDSLRVGEQVAAIGNPLGELANSMTVGYISALNRDVNIDGVSRNKIQTDAAVNRGNSGGPLLNLQGEVIGVVSAKSVGMDVEGLGFAIPSNQVKTVIDQLMQYGFVRGRAVLGVQITVQNGSGKVQVASVNRNSAAERGGIIESDILLSANGKELSTFADLRMVLDGLSPGDAMELRILRNNDEVVLTIILDEYTPSGF